MRHLLALGLLAMTTAAHAQRQGNDDFYRLGPDSMQHEGVPHGEVVGPVRPAERSVSRHAARLLGLCAGAVRHRQARRLMVFQDGHAFLDPDGQRPRDRT